MSANGSKGEPVMTQPRAGDDMNDPWPMFAGEVFTLPCEGCGEPVTLKRALGDAEDVATAWADDQIAAWCVPCALAAGIGAKS